MAFCITTWLPLRRTSAKPCWTRTLHTSRPERTLSLPNLNLKPSHKDLGVGALLNLAWRGCLEKQLDCFLEIPSGRFDRVTLARDIELRAKSNVAVPFAFDNRRHLLHVFHLLPFANDSKTANSACGSA